MKRDGLTQKGFTFPEIIVVFGVVVMLFSLAVSGTLKAQQGTSLQSFLMVLVSDIKNQQVNAMTGFTLGGATSSNFGIYFDQDGYTLFKGDVYNASDPNNFVVKLPDNIAFFDVKFPNSTLLLLKGNGEVSGFVMGANSVSLKTTINTTKTITVNKLGTVVGAD